MRRLLVLAVSLSLAAAPAIARAEEPVMPRETTSAAPKVALRWLEVKPSPDGQWRYRVELTITNTGKKVLQLDGPSVAEGSALSNDLFVVTVDGKEVAYQGVMAKRAPPSRFIKVRPGASWVVAVELGDWYPIAPGPHRVTVAFSHQNHFSPDDVRLESAPIEREFR